MRPRVSWMTGNDDSILELLHEHNLALGPRAIHTNITRRGVSMSYTTVNRRLETLQENGLVEKFDEKRGYYESTEKAGRYLSGEIDPSELENSDSSKNERSNCDTTEA